MHARMNLRPRFPSPIKVKTDSRGFYGCNNTNSVLENNVLSKTQPVFAILPRSRQGVAAHQLASRYGQGHLVARIQVYYRADHLAQGPNGRKVLHGFTRNSCHECGSQHCTQGHAIRYRPSDLRVPSHDCVPSYYRETSSPHGTLRSS